MVSPYFSSGITNVQPSYQPFYHVQSMYANNRGLLYFHVTTEKHYGLSRSKMALRLLGVKVAMHYVSSCCEVFETILSCTWNFAFAPRVTTTSHAGISYSRVIPNTSSRFLCSHLDTVSFTYVRLQMKQDERWKI